MVSQLTTGGVGAVLHGRGSQATTTTTTTSNQHGAQGLPSQPILWGSQPVVLTIRANDLQTMDLVLQDILFRVQCRVKRPIAIVRRIHNRDLQRALTHAMPRIGNWTYRLKPKTSLSVYLLWDCHVCACILISLIPICAAAFPNVNVWWIQLRTM